MSMRINDGGRKNMHEALDRIITYINNHSQDIAGMFDLVLIESLLTPDGDIFIKHSTCTELVELEDGRFEAEVSWTEHEEYDAETDTLLSEYIEETEF